MNEDAIRALVRETLERKESRDQEHRGRAPQPLQFAAHSSHYRYTTLPPAGGPCLIEPGVACNHCGYCQSHGH
jgi:hypothetical protein